MRVVRFLLRALAAGAAIAVSIAGAYALLDTGSGAPQSDSTSVGALPSATSSESGSTQGTPQEGARLRDKGGENPLASRAEATWTAFARSIPAQIGIAIAPLGGTSTRALGPLQTGHAWSTLKVPILVTLMRDQTLNSEAEGWAQAALTASDNDAAAALFGRLEELHGGLKGASQAVQSTLRSAGDTDTTVAMAPPPSGAISSFGQTEWSLAGSVRFFQALGRGCLLPPSQTAYVLGLMEEPIPEQRWGIAGPSLPVDWQVASKGGWGPEGSAAGPYLVRQAGVIEVGNTAVVIAAAAQADSGAFGDGVSALNRVADWLADNLRQSANRIGADCRTGRR